MPATNLGYKVNDVEIESITLINADGNYIDLRAVVIEFNIYHNLFIKGTKCELIVSDTNSLINFIPIVGDETIHIAFKTPSFEKMREYVFRVYKISDLDRSTQRGETYVIHAISQEVFDNLRKSVNKSFVDLTGDKIVNAIYEGYLKPSVDDHSRIKKKNIINTQASSNRQSIVFPGIKPFEAIDYVGQESIPDISTQQTITPNYIFFERQDGWYFKTIDSMLYAKPFDDFYLADAATEKKNEGGDVIHEYQNISSLEILDRLDVMKKTHQGLYSHTVETIDPITKRFKQDKFLYKDEMKNIAHLEDHDFDGDNLVLRKNFGSDYYVSKKSSLNKDSDNSITYYTISNIGENYNKQDYLNKAINTDTQIRNPRVLHNTLKYDVASRIQLSNIRLSVVIPGNSDIQIGDVVNLHIPEASQNEEYMKKISRMYDKRFFVTAVRHTHQKVDNIYFTVLECVKDTYATQTKEIDYKPTTDDEE